MRAERRACWENTGPSGMLFLRSLGFPGGFTSKRDADKLCAMIYVVRTHVACYSTPFTLDAGFSVCWLYYLLQYAKRFVK